MLKHDRFALILEHGYPVLGHSPDMVPTYIVGECEHGAVLRPALAGVCAEAATVVEHDVLACRCTSSPVKEGKHMKHHKGLTKWRYGWPRVAASLQALSST
jgi:hypothetical protein